MCLMEGGKLRANSVSYVSSYLRGGYGPKKNCGAQAKKRTCAFTQVLGIHGAPERIRTSDLCLRRAALYPAELRAHSKPRITRQFRVRNLTCAGGVCPAPELNSSLRFSAFSVRE